MAILSVNLRLERAQLSSVIHLSGSVLPLSDDDLRWHFI
jgi:hypothetical protein